MADWLFWFIIICEYGFALWYIILSISMAHSLITKKRNGPTFAIFAVSVVRLYDVLVWLIPTLFILRKNNLNMVIVSRLPIDIMLTVTITYFMWQFYLKDWWRLWKNKHR